MRYGLAGDPCSRRATAAGVVHGTNTDPRADKSSTYAEDGDRHHRDDERGVRVSGLAGVEQAEILPDHPDRQREDEADRTRHVRAGVLAGECLEDRCTDPEHCPGDRQPACRCLVRGIVARPGHEREHAVEQHRPRRPVEKAHVPAGEPGQALAEEPHRERPREPGGERELRGARDEQPDPDQQLNGREGHIPGDGVRRDQVRGPVDRAGRHRVEDLPRETGSEHERLELQRAVQQPQQA